MASITNLVSYELNGVKESFANWISNISPTDTPFVSMTGKESITNKYFQWQTDSLGKVNENNAYAEGSDADNSTLTATSVQKNVTQILRKVVQVSDTADALSSYGRGSELAYQMEKAGAEIKRDLEWAFLHNTDATDGTYAVAAGHAANTTGPLQPGVPGISGTAPNLVTGIGSGNSTGTTASTVTGTPINGVTPAAYASGVRKTAGFEGLVAKAGVFSPDAISGNVAVNKVIATGLTEDDLFDLTRDLYLAGAQPNIIMFHPSQAKFFSGLMEIGAGANGNRQRMFDGAADTKVNTYVSVLVDPLGQEFKLIPNRFMPEKKVFIFDPADWTQMVLRAPQRTKLAKTGSFEKWMIEMEVGLRHRNPFASGVLTFA